MDSGWLKVLDIGGPKAIGLAVASAGIHFSAANGILGLDSLPAVVIPASAVGMIVFGAFGGVWLASQLIAVPRQWIRKSKREANIREALNSLSREEAEVLVPLALTNTRSTEGSMWNPVMMALCQKGLLARAGGMGHPDRWAFTVPAHVWPEMKKWGRALNPGDQA